MEDFFFFLPLCVPILPHHVQKQREGLRRQPAPTPWDLLTSAAVKHNQPVNNWRGFIIINKPRATVTLQKTASDCHSRLKQRSSHLLPTAARHSQPRVHIHAGDKQNGWPCCRWAPPDKTPRVWAGFAKTLFNKEAKRQLFDVCCCCCCCCCLFVRLWFLVSPR